MRNWLLVLIGLFITFVGVITKNFFYTTKFILGKRLTIKKLLIILLCLPLFYSCKFDEVKEYEKKKIVIQVDTLDIEQIKIETH